MAEYPFPVVHTFPLKAKSLICREELWVSDTKRPNHYRKTHASNRGAESIGKIETDLTFLKELGLIQQKHNTTDRSKGKVRKDYWEVHYEVALIVEGRSIRFEARWPSKDKLKSGETQRTLSAKLFGIAAAFLPGTA